MKKVILLLSVMLTAAVSAQKSIGVDWDYTVSCAGMAKDGSYMVQVECVGKKAAKALDRAKKSAIHAVLFKGVTGSAAGCTTQRPIVTDRSVTESNTEFFKTFFDDKKGSWEMYVTGITGTQPMTSKVRGGYQVTVTLIVMKDDLRKLLEKEGIIRGLASGF